MALPLIMFGGVVIRAAPKIASWLIKNYGAKQASKAAIKKAGKNIETVKTIKQGQSIINKAGGSPKPWWGGSRARTPSSSSAQTSKKSWEGWEDNKPKSWKGWKESPKTNTSAAKRAGSTVKTIKDAPKEVAAAVKKGKAGKKLARNLILGASGVASLPFLLPKSSGPKQEINNKIKKKSGNKTSSSAVQKQNPKQPINGTTSAQKNANRNNKKEVTAAAAQASAKKAAVKNKAKKKKATPKKKKSKETLFEYITSGTGPRKETTVALYKGGPDVTIDSSKDAYAGYDTLAKKGGSIKKSMKKAKAKGKKRPSLRGWGAAQRGF